MGAFGLLLDGCPVRPGPESAAVGPNGSVTLRFPVAVTANGYYFTTAGPDPAHDPIAWAVGGIVAPPSVAKNSPAGMAATAASFFRASLSGGLGDLWAGKEGPWTGVGASAWRLDVHGALHLYPGRQYATPAAPRGARVEVCARQMWMSVLG